MTEEFADVAVVGGGLAGLAATYELSRRGLRVALFEQFELGHDHGSSHGQGRILRLAYDSPEYVSLAQRSLVGWRELEDQTGKTLFREYGGVDVGPSEQIAVIVDALTSAGSSSERIATNEGRVRFPWITIPDGWEILYQPDAGVLNADACLQTFVSLAHDAGATIHHNVRVGGILDQGTSVAIESSAGTMHAQLVVITAGGWAKGILDPLGLSVPLRVTREHVAYFEPRTNFQSGPFIWHPPDSFEYYGLPNGTDPLMKVGQHLAGPETDASAPAELELARTEDISQFVAGHLPGVVATPVRSETCLYSSTPDDDFVIDRVGSIVIGVGFGGHGFKFGPQIGTMLADLAQGIDIDFSSRLSLSRFSEDIPYAG